MLEGMSDELGAAHTLCTLTSSVPGNAPTKRVGSPGRPLINANQWHQSKTAMPEGVTEVDSYWTQSGKKVIE